MADKQNVSSLIAKIRDRMAERAVNGTPYWTAPVENSARSTAGCLLVGMLLGKLPAEDASALCETLICEQNDDGSWSSVVGEPGDLSLTLEVVEALGEARVPFAREALSEAIDWLKDRRIHATLDRETARLLRSLTDFPPSNLERVFEPVTRWFLENASLRVSLYLTRAGLRQALKILSYSKRKAYGRSRELIQLQYVDGSWDGSTRSTVFALLALRHAGMPADDGVMERGWRYLRNLQVWDGDSLVQNPCDFSNLLHATAVRSLVMTGAEPEVTATSVLTLLHQQRGSGGWALGGLLATDLFTTSLALDALSFVGDNPVETSWARRRAALLLTRTQNPDGGWPVYYFTLSRLKKLIGYRGRVDGFASVTDVTALAVQALSYSGEQDREIEQTIDRGVRYLLRLQKSNGLWLSGVRGSDIFTTSRTIEALLGAAPDKTRGPVTNAVRALMRRQISDGSWGNSHDTACAVRALAGVPGVPAEVIRRGRKALEAAAEVTGTEWSVEGPMFPLPFDEPLSGAHDLVTLWAIEALAPLGAASKSQRTANRRSRSVYRRTD